MTLPWVTGPFLVTVTAVPTVAKRMEPSLIDHRAPGIRVCYQKGGVGSQYWVGWGGTGLGS